MTSASISNSVALLPLREWKERESERQILAPQTPGRCDAANKQMFLRKTAVAYGIAELLRQTRAHRYSASSHMSLVGQSNIDNFVVRTKVFGRGSHPTWRDIDGVEMLSPRLLTNIVEPSFLWDGDDGDREEMGSFLGVEFPSLSVSDGAAVFVNQSEEDTRCHLFGVLLYELFFECSLLSAGNTRGIRAHTYEGGLKSALEIDDVPPESASKKTKLVDLRAAGAPGIRSSTAHVSREISCSALQNGECVTLLEEGIPSSLCLVIQSLLDCGEDDRPASAYDSLEEVIIDLHLLMLEPCRFLFDHEPAYDNNGRIKLLFREHQLYGRENEELLITEAFCRVSSGKRESLFIGGFSGSGKSRLVNGLTARVDVSGGYVLTHKFDQLSQEKTILEVVAMFNDLCLLIRNKSSQQDLLVMVNDLVCVFGSDLSVLARLLPNIKSLAPQLDSFDGVQESHNQMNLRSICFTLQRFIGVVSSELHPVVIFLDDLQWCDKSALTVVESLLCDATGSACLFFVGTYRSNEVAGDHEILCLAQRLKSFGVPTTMLSLEGLNPKDLNTMISDALCVFPRISEPLSDIIYQKTKGNPFFVIAFIKSLVERGLLDYNISARRWVWDEDDLSSMDVTGNVLYLLTSKMSGLSTSIQSALKIAACFGSVIKESVVAALEIDPAHSDISDMLEQVVKEGFMVKIGTSDFKFVHDKVREAAYSLIPEKDKDQFHYSIGMSLYSMTTGNIADDILPTIADQIKHGIGNLADENPEVQIEIAELYYFAGMQSAASSDHAASRSYLTYALSLLPTDRWKSQYDLSLRFSLQLAKSCNSCGDIEKTQCILQEITEQCHHSIEDKLPALALLAAILISGNRFLEAYTLCHKVLSQLGEEIPESLQPDQITEMVEATSKMVQRISEKDLLKMKEMDERLSITMNFYRIMGNAVYFGKPGMIIFVASRMVQLTMENGLCEHSILGFVQFAAIICSSKIAKKSIERASQIGKAAMSCSRKRYNTATQLPSIYHCYYGFIAFHTEPLQTCADMLRQGFDAGMSLGESDTAFVNAIQHIRTAVIAGESLPILLEKVDYYLALANTYQNEIAKTYLSIFRGTISTLFDKGVTTSLSSLAIDAPTNIANAKVLEVIYYHRAIQAYWQSHSERCQYYIKKFLEKSYDVGKLNSKIIVFIHGMNSFQLMKRQSSTKNRSISKRAIKELKTAASLSSWNFSNKVHLLEAEHFSLQNLNSEAQASYAAAISSARSSGFIHEQGLACELAGYHCKNADDGSSAAIFFDQAKRCYIEWGSQMKVDSVTEQLESLTNYTPIGPSL